MNHPEPRPSGSGEHADEECCPITSDFANADVLESQTDYAIDTNGLCRDFGNKRALEDFTLKVPNGRVVAVLGPNGAGKTTLLRMLLGLIEPTAGTATILGHPARDLPADIACRIVSMGDGYEPPRWARLKSMMKLQAAASPRFDMNKAAWLLEMQGLDPSDNHSLLSKGQKRWSLATLALASGADLLMFDEPADGLDPSARIRLYEHLRDYATQQNATILVTTHIISDIERVADDVAIINNGRLSLYASLEDIREHVREVELPETRCVPTFHPSVRLLGRRLIGTTLLAWVICDLDDAHHHLESMADGQARVRTCNLESVYLALSEYSPQYVDAKKEQVA